MQVAYFVQQETKVSVRNPAGTDLYVIGIEHGTEELSILLPTHQSKETKAKFCHALIEAIQREILPELED